MVKVDAELELEVQINSTSKWEVGSISRKEINMSKDVVARNQKGFRENRSKGKSAGARLWVDLGI